MPQRGQGAYKELKSQQILYTHRGFNAIWREGDKWTWPFQGIQKLTSSVFEWPCPETFLLWGRTFLQVRPVFIVYVYLEAWHIERTGAVFCVECGTYHPIDIFSTVTKMWDLM